MKYRKKPVIIEAFQYDGDLISNHTGKYYVPDWAAKAFEDGTIYHGSLEPDSPPYELFIKTLEGIHHAAVADYVIQGVKGELYPCKPDIFEMTYEPVTDEDAVPLSCGPVVGEGWQPMDTAPEDGTFILIAFLDNKRNPVVRQAAWWNRNGCCYDHNWYECDLDEVDAPQIIYRPLAWRPLPDAPAVPTQKEGTK